MAGESVVGALRAVLGMDTAGFEDGANRAVSTLKHMGEQMLSVFTGVGLEHAVEEVFKRIVDAIRDGVTESLKFADEMGKTAQKVGVGVEELTKLRVAAVISDVSMESLSRALGVLSKNMTDTAAGTGKTEAQFRTLGVAVKNSDGSLRPVTSVLADIADKFKGAGDGAGKTAAAMALLGARGGRELIPLLNQGGQALRDWGDAAERMGLVVIPETAHQAEKFQDNLKLLTLAKQGLANLITAELLPALVNLSNQWVDNVTKGDAVRSTATKIVAAIKDMVAFFYQAAAADEVLGSSLNLLLQAADAFGDGVAAVFNKLGTVVNEALQYLVGLAQPIVDFFASWASKLVNTFSLFGSGINTAVTYGLGLLNKVLPETTEQSDKLTGSITALTNIFSSDAFGKAGDKLSSAGAKLGGFSAAMDGARQKALDLFTTMDHGHESVNKGLAPPDTRLSDELNKLRIQTIDVQQGFSGFATGLVEMSIHLGLVQKDASDLTDKFGNLKPAVERLNDAMLLLQGAQLTQDSLAPYDVLAEKLEKINLLYAAGAISAETAATASRNAAVSTGQAWDIAGSKIVGDLASGLAAFAAQNKALSGAAKAAAIAQAVINTYTAATKALATYPPPLSYAAAAAAVVAGLGMVAKIQAQSFATGGSFKVPGGISGVDTQIVPLNLAAGERVDITPAGEVDRGTGTRAPSEVRVSGRLRDVLTGQNLRDLIESLNEAHSNGYRLTFAEA
jgi:hypothetical protein